MKKSFGLVDSDKHLQVDVLTAPPVTVDTSEIESNQTDGSQITKIKETLGTDDTKNNSSGNITPVTVGNVTTITVSRIIKGTTETKTDTFNTLTGVFTWGEWA